MRKDISFLESEKNGLEQVNESMRNILSIGISTNGNAEITMAKKNPNAKIIATTIDKVGIEKTRQEVSQAGLANQIELRIEDVSQPMPYYDNTFDYVYARLVLHYLDKMAFKNAVSEIWRVLKPNGQVYIAVKSEKDLANKKVISFDVETNLTSYVDAWDKAGKMHQRQFLNPAMIEKYMSEFKILSIKEFEEQTYSDYLRTIKVPNLASLIEVIARKE